MTIELDTPAAAQEIKRLERCISDLVNLVTLPASWLGAEPGTIARGLLDVLEDMLALDLGFLRLTDPAIGRSIEAVRVAPGRKLPTRAGAVGAMVDRWFDQHPGQWPDVLRQRVGEGGLCLVPLPVGLHGELGVLVAGSERRDFPTETERLLLTVAKNQALIAFTAHLRDLKDRKQRDAGFRTIVDTTPECVKVMARDGTLLLVNAAGAAMGGAPSAEAVIGANYYDFVAPEDRERYREFHQRVCDGEKGCLEYTIVTLQGERRRMETNAAPMLNQDGSVVLLGVGRDVTARREAEGRLRRSEAFLAEAQRLSLTGSFAWRPDRDEITWSDQVYRIFQFDPAEPVTFERARTRIHPDDLALFSDVARRARADGAGFEFEHRLLMPDRSVKHLHVVAHAVRESAGGREFIGAVQDVTERRHSQEALDRSREELTRVARVSSLGALAASIAHEVNQPLSGIVTNASTGLRMLAAEPPNLEGARETLRRAIRDGHRASEVVTRLRGLFTGKEVAGAPVDLNDAASEVLVLAAGTLRRSRVAVRPELANRLPAVSGDRVQLQQVILNLLLNAADAMSAVDGRPRQLVVRTARDDDGVSLSVKDAGVGFAPEDGERMFDAFYTTKGHGMGIGLSVSRSIIARHRGRLWAAPNEGPGATFTFTIPLAADTADTKV
jgi:PAS domain S-box-containing protein